MSISLSRRLINLIESLNKKRLNENASVADENDGFDVTAEVFSEDHPPAHMHVFNKDKSKEIARVIIRNRKPRTVTDIIPYKGEFLTQKERLAILRMMRAFDPKERQSYYSKAKGLWNRLHPKFKIGEKSNTNSTE